MFGRDLPDPEQTLALETPEQCQAVEESQDSILEVLRRQAEALRLEVDELEHEKTTLENRNHQAKAELRPLMEEYTRKQLHRVYTVSSSDAEANQQILPENAAMMPQLRELHGISIAASASTEGDLPETVAVPVPARDDDANENRSPQNRLTEAAQTKEKGIMGRLLAGDEPEHFFSAAPPEHRDNLRSGGSSRKKQEKSLEWFAAASKALAWLNGFRIEFNPDPNLAAGNGRNQLWVCFFHDRPALDAASAQGLQPPDHKKKKQPVREEAWLRMAFQETRLRGCWKLKAARWSPCGPGQRQQQKQSENSPVHPKQRQDAPDYSQCVIEDLVAWAVESSDLDPTSSTAHPEVQDRFSRFAAAGQGAEQMERLWGILQFLLMEIRGRWREFSDRRTAIRGWVAALNRSSSLPTAGAGAFQTPPRESFRPTGPSTGPTDPDTAAFLASLPESSLRRIQELQTKVLRVRWVTQHTTPVSSQQTQADSATGSTESSRPSQQQTSSLLEDDNPFSDRRRVQPMAPPSSASSSSSSSSLYTTAGQGLGSSTEDGLERLQVQLQDGLDLSITVDGRLSFHHKECVQLKAISAVVGWTRSQLLWIKDRVNSRETIQSAPPMVGTAVNPHPVSYADAEASEKQREKDTMDVMAMQDDVYDYDQVNQTSTTLRNESTTAGRLGELDRSSSADPTSPTAEPQAVAGSPIETFNLLTDTVERTLRLMYA